MHRQLLSALLAIFVLISTTITGVAGAATDPPALVVTLIAPAKLATLGQRGANPRVQKAVYWLAMARQQGDDPRSVADHAVRVAGYTNELARQLTATALLRNLDIATKLGCLDAEGLAEMRRGHAPTVRKGPYQGDQLSVDHIIPRAVCPELDNVIANLELMPLRLNSAKRDHVGDRQLGKARELHQAHLLGATGLSKVELAALR